MDVYEIHFLHLRRLDLETESQTSPSQGPDRRVQGEVSLCGGRDRGLALNTPGRARPQDQFVAVLRGIETRKK